MSSASSCSNARDARWCARRMPAPRSSTAPRRSCARHAASRRWPPSSARDDAGALSIATTHTQARYVLPPVLKRFRDKYPKVRLHLHQGNSEQIADLAATDRIDFAIATGGEPDLRRPRAPALLSLAPRHRRARWPSARRDQQARIRGSREVSAGHLFVQLQRTFVTGGAVRRRRADAQRGAHRLGLRM